MRKIIIVIAAVVLTTLFAYAQMGGMHGNHHPSSGHPQHEGMMGGEHAPSVEMDGDHQSHQTMSGQMRTQNMMRNMTGMVNRMNSILHSMSDSMTNMDMMEHEPMQDMSRVMNEMSYVLGDMAVHMADGNMGPDTMHELYSRMESISGMIETLEPQAHSH